MDVVVRGQVDVVVELAEWDAGGAEAGDMHVGQEVSTFRFVRCSTLSRHVGVRFEAEAAV